MNIPALARRRARGEEGVALAWALAFLVVVGVIVFFVLGYSDTSIRSTARLADQRSALYGVDGAVNNAIRYVQNDTTLSRGASSGQPCNLNDTGANGINSLDVSVTCSPVSGSGVPLGTSTAPGFAVLTMAPYHGQAPTNGCVNVNNELGLAQVQDSKLLQVTGNVYVNSDADSDTWSGGCPNTGAAQHIQVKGNVRQAESCHDLDVVQPVPAVTPPYSIVCADALAGSAAVGSFPAAPDPAIADPASWAASISAPPATRAVPTCPTGMLVTFTPGTYTDAAGLTNLMNGTTCPGRLFWFQPGSYYFNFSNNAGAWTINDAAARIVGGAANAVPSGATTVGPVTVAATNPPAPTTSNPGYSNLANAVAIGESPTPLSATTGNFTTTNQTRWITTDGYAISPQIPGGSTGLSVTAKVVHGETYGNPAQISSLQLLVRNAADTATLCTVTVPTSPSGVGISFTSPALPAGCLDAAALNTGAFSLRYQIVHSTCGGSNPACTNISSSLDGVALNVTYTVPARAAWDPTNPSTVTAASPTVPGACVHDGDYGFNASTGVQFVFGGNSHVILQSGAFELCDSFSSTHQEIVMYGVKAASGSGPQTATLTPTTANPGSGTWTPSTPSNTYGQAKTIDGSTVSSSFSGGSQVTRTFVLSGFKPSTPIDPASTNVSVSVRVAHQESSSTRFDTQQVTLTPTTGTGCTVGLNDSGSLSPAESPTVNCLTLAEINSGVAITYSVRYNCSSTCGTTRTAELDGVELVVNYTPPVAASALNPESGCVTQAPYYSPQDHSPAYNGACALFAVASNSNGGHSPRVAAFWGTVYAPAAALDVPVDILTVPVFNRGVVARMLMLGYNVAANASVPITTTPITANVAANRRVILVATIPGKTTKLVADVEFCDSLSPGCTSVGGTKIWSWTVTR